MNMNKWKTIIMSDLHLGAIQSQSDKILEFLEQNDAETIILNGLVIVTGKQIGRASCRERVYVLV